MKNAVVHGLFCGRVSGQVNVIEMGRITIGIDDDERSLQRPGIHSNRSARECRGCGESELEWTPRSGKRLAAFRHVKNGSAVVVLDCPVCAVRNGPFQTEYVKAIGGDCYNCRGQNEHQDFLHAFMLACGRHVSLGGQMRLAGEIAVDVVRGFAALGDGPDDQ